MIYEVHLRSPYRIIRVEASHFYVQEGGYIIFSDSSRAMHMFHARQVISITTATHVNNVHYPVGSPEGRVAPLTQDSPESQDELVREHAAPSIRRDVPPPAYPGLASQYSEPSYQQNMAAAQYRPTRPALPEGYYDTLETPTIERYVTTMEYDREEMNSNV